MTTNEIIRLENIRRNFIVGSETVHALRGVNFTINSGEFVTIMGPPKTCIISCAP